MDNNILACILGVFSIIISNLLRIYHKKHNTDYKYDLGAQTRVWGGIAAGIIMLIGGFLNGCLG